MHILPFMFRETISTRAYSASRGIDHIAPESVDSQSPPGESNRKQQRISRACDLCRIKKAKVGPSLAFFPLHSYKK